MRTKRCPRCKGTGKVTGHRVYPGTGAYRPINDCADCQGVGTVPAKPATPERVVYRVRFELLIPAEGTRHADSIAREFVREGLSNLEFNGSLPFGESVTIIRDPSHRVEEERPDKSEPGAPGWQPAWEE